MARATQPQTELRPTARRPALAGLATIIGTYALSFLVITNLWTSHHYLVLTVASPDRSTIWPNNLLLFCVTLIPMATRFLGRHPLSDRAAAAYGLIGLCCTAAFMLLRRHAAHVTHNRLHRIIHHRVLRRAWACFIAVSAILFLPIVGIGTSPDRVDEHSGAAVSCP